MKKKKKQPVGQSPLGSLILRDRAQRVQEKWAREMLDESEINKSPVKPSLPLNPLSTGMVKDKELDVFQEFFQGKLTESEIAERISKSIGDVSNSRIIKELAEGFGVLQQAQIRHALKAGSLPDPVVTEHSEGHEQEIILIVGDRVFGPKKPS